MEPSHGLYPKESAGSSSGFIGKDKDKENNNVTGIDAGHTVKIVLVGDAKVGKSALVSVYLSATFLKDYEPTIFDVFEGNVRTGDRTVAFSLCDVAGGSTYEKLDLKKLRGVCYLDTDVYIICFSVVDRASFEHVKEEWYPEITAKGPVSVLLVGTKIDLRDAPEGKEEERERELKKAGIVPVTTEEGTNLANEINALGYMECSVLESVNLKEIFDTAIKAALAGDSNKKSDNCNVM